MSHFPEGSIVRINDPNHTLYAELGEIHLKPPPGSQKGFLRLAVKGRHYQINESFLELISAPMSDAAVLRRAADLLDAEDFRDSEMDRAAGWMRLNMERMADQLEAEQAPILDPLSMCQEVDAWLKKHNPDDTALHPDAKAVWTKLRRVLEQATP